MRIIGIAFLLLAARIAAQSSYVLATGFHPHHSPIGIVWLALTSVVMFALAYGKGRTGEALGNPVLSTEARVTLVDGVLAAAVLAGLVLNTVFGWWWADPVAGFVIVFYGAREGRAALADGRSRAERLNLPKHLPNRAVVADRQPLETRNPLFKRVSGAGATGLEPATSGVTGSRTSGLAGTGGHTVTLSGRFRDPSVG